MNDMTRNAILAWIDTLASRRRRPTDIGVTIDEAWRCIKVVCLSTSEAAELQALLSSLDEQGAVTDKESR